MLCNVVAEILRLRGLVFSSVSLEHVCCSFDYASLAYSIKILAVKVVEVRIPDSETISHELMVVRSGW
jgi:hypothetical protein